MRVGWLDAQRSADPGSNHRGEAATDGLRARNPLPKQDIISVD